MHSQNNPKQGQLEIIYIFHVSVKKINNLFPHGIGGNRKLSSSTNADQKLL